MQTKKEAKYNPPSSGEDDEEEEQVVTKKKQVQKKKKGKKIVKEEETEENEQIHPDDQYNLKKALHPTAVIFQIAFKVGAGVMYILGSTILQDQLVFISCILLMSFDFWTVKNITGRLLVGLRWWYDFDDEGNEIMKFESPDCKFQPNIVDKSFFWSFQFGISVFWLVFLVLNIISFGFYWGILDTICFVLSAGNLYNFYKCSGEHQDKLKNMRNKYLAKGIFNMMK